MSEDTPSPKAVAIEALIRIAQDRLNPDLALQAASQLLSHCEKEAD